MNDREDVDLALVGKLDRFEALGRAALGAGDPGGVDKNRTARSALRTHQMGLGLELEEGDNRARPAIGRCLSLLSHWDASRIRAGGSDSPLSSCSIRPFHSGQRSVNPEG